MKNGQPHKFDTISAYHQFMGLPKPEHPLVSVIRFDTLHYPVADGSTTLINNFYSIALKRNFDGKLNYGQQTYDFDEGIMVFMAPGQVLTFDTDASSIHVGWLLLIHPDFLWNTPLAKTIRQYDFFQLCGPRSPAPVRQRRKHDDGHHAKHWPGIPRQHRPVQPTRHSGPDRAVADLLGPFLPPAVHHPQDYRSSHAESVRGPADGLFYQRDTGPKGPAHRAVHRRQPERIP